MVITLFSGGKGGVGKSTTCVTLASLVLDQSPVILDIDSQKACDAFDLPGATVLHPDPENIRPHLPVDRRRPCFIDCPPALSITAEALRCADLIIVPVQAEYLSLRAVVLTLPLLQTNYRTTAIGLLLTMHCASVHESCRVREALYDEYSEHAFRAIIPRSSFVQNATAQGQSVTDFAPKCRAARSYRNLLQEIQCLHMI